MSQGGGTPLVTYASNGKQISNAAGTKIVDPVLPETYIGIGGQSILIGNGPDKLFAHAYSGSGKGAAVLRIFGLEWDDAGWPFLRWSD